MKWHGPVFGDIRVTRRFAWFPVKLDNGDRVWLEYYMHTEMYGYHPFGCGHAWVDYAFGARKTCNSEPTTPET